MPLAFSPGMFTRDTRMSDALAERPGLREILPAFHPAFSRLTHPVLGRILPRLVTVADAARIAGIDPDAMLAVMNLPGPPPPAAVGVHVSDATPHWLTASPVRELDARPALARGEEPFATIMQHLRQLPPGEILTVLAPFEPAPLLRLMGGRGWATHVGWDGETCRASFWKPPSVSDPAPDAGERLRRVEHGAILDVRGLEPPGPMQLVLAALDDPANLPLTILHHREPVLLYPKLAERGLSWTVTTTDDHVEIRVDRA